MTTVMPLVLFQLRPKFPAFILNWSSTLYNLMARVKTLYKPCVFRARPSFPLQKVAIGGVWFFTERNWSQESCHGNGITSVFFLWCTCTFLEPSWKNTAPYISRDILNSVFCYLVALGFLHHHFPNLPYTKTLRSLQQKDIPKRKTLKDGSKVLVINHALILTSSVLTSDRWFQILTDKINIVFSIHRNLFCS